MSDAAPASAAPGPAFTQVPFRGMITLSIMLATIMQVLDTTIANVALPHMRGSLGASTDTVTWVLTSYIVAAAIMTPVTGWLADRLGRKALFLVSVAGFTGSSVLCGMAGSLETMVVFRVFQGLFGASLVPLSQSVMLDINPRERHGQAMALWGAGIMVGPILGPTLGGWLTETFDWRWVFYVNLPVGVLAFIGLWIFLPKGERRVRRFDFFGFALLSLAVGALQLFLDRGETVDWFSATEIWIEGGLALGAFWMFVVHTFTARDGFIDPVIFRNRNLVAGLILIFVIGIILLATMSLLPTMLQNLYGYPVVTTGLVLAPRGVGTMISMLMVGRLLRYVDARLLILTGLLLVAVSLWQMAGFTLQMGQTPLITTGVTQGLGLGLIFVPLSTTAFSTLEAAARTEAAALYSLLRNIGSSVGVSIVTAMLARNTQINRSTLVENITPFNPQLDLSMGHLLGMDQSAVLGVISGEINRQAAMIGYLNDFKMMMVVTLLSVPLLLLVDKPAPSKAG